LVLLFGLLLPLALPALAGEQLLEPEPIEIRNIEVKFTGVANISEEVVRANMSMRKGMDYDDNMIDRDIRSLYRTGLFEFIEVKRIMIGTTLVDLIVEVRPKYRVSAVRFDGNRKIKDKRLAKEITTQANYAIDERRIKEDAEKIFDYYQKRGYSQAKVDYVIERNPATGFGTIIYKIEEGGKIKIKDIEFEGNANVKGRTLRKEMETKKWWMFSWLTGKGKLNDETFEDDLDKLRDYYREQGYLDVEISQTNVKFTYPNRNKMVITISVSEGRQYRIGRIAFTGNSTYPSDLLQRLVRTRSGDVFEPSKLDEEIELMDDFYGQFGYLETRIRLVRNPNITTGDIDIEFEVSESEKYFVESINIEGNTKTKSIVILRELALTPGMVFDSVRMKTSQLRLENTQFFEEVNVVPESTNIPQRKNLKISVREGRTGSLSFGAGFSSLERAVVFIELTQGNFDLFNRRSFFQGDGQKMRLRAQIGAESSQFIIAFEEPWLFERQLALGFEFFRSQSDFTSSLYDELRFGFEVYMRRRLIELIEGRLSYRYEEVDIFNVTPSIFFPIYAGKTNVSRVGMTFLRDTRDSLITSTRGSRFEFITELAGGPLKGDIDYYRLEGRAAKYLPIFRFHKQVIEILGRTGVVKQYGDSLTVPFFDRYFLGGPRTLRGFEFRDVGPKDPTIGEPLGGKTYAFGSVEYSFDIVDPLRFALFYDVGFVNRGGYDWGYSDYNDNWGFGIRFFVMGSPLRLDYGIPITTDSFNDKGAQFNFSFGSRF
jgi:outer membrane protein insertion porin family